MEYLTAFGLTLAVEVPWTVALAPALGVARPRIARFAVLANATSHPVFWFIVVPLVRQLGVGRLGAIAFGETLVVLYEAVVLRAANPGRLDVADGAPLLVSLSSNLLSVAVGLVL